jgi:hypothetical protein
MPSSPRATFLLAFCREIAATERNLSVEVKIGISESPRELVINSPQSPEEVEELVRAALGKGSPVLELTDERGRKVLVQTSKIAYVDIGVADVRRVGFGG